MPKSALKQNFSNSFNAEPQNVKPNFIRLSIPTLSIPGYLMAAIDFELDPDTIFISILVRGSTRPH